MKAMNWTLAEEAIYRPYELIMKIFKEKKCVTNEDGTYLDTFYLNRIDKLLKKWIKEDNMELITAFYIAFPDLGMHEESEYDDNKTYQKLESIVLENDFRSLYIIALEKLQFFYTHSNDLEELAQYWIDNANKYGNNQDEDNKLDIAKKAFLACINSERVLDIKDRAWYKEKYQELIKAGIMTEED